MDNQPSEKPLVWVRSSKKDLLEFPDEVIDTVGHALGLAQNGMKYHKAKPLRGLGSRFWKFNTDTYRAVYTVHFEKAVYVLHCFQKKSTKGIATPQQELDLIQQCLKDAETHYKEHFND